MRVLLLGLALVLAGCSAAPPGGTPPLASPPSAPPVEPTPPSANPPEPEPPSPAPAPQPPEPPRNWALDVPVGNVSIGSNLSEVVGVPGDVVNLTLGVDGPTDKVSVQGGDWLQFIGIRGIIFVPAAEGRRVVEARLLVGPEAAVSLMVSAGGDNHRVTGPPIRLQPRAGGAPLVQEVNVTRADDVVNLTRGLHLLNGTPPRVIVSAGRYASTCDTDVRIGGRFSLWEFEGQRILVGFAHFVANDACTTMPERTPRLVATANFSPGPLDVRVYEAWTCLCLAATGWESMEASFQVG